MSTFTCSACGETYAKDWSDEDAAAEVRAAFTAAELTDTAVVCEDCWQRMRSSMPDLDRRYDTR